MRSANQVFQQGSVTYFFSSLFFPAELRRQIVTVYAFVRLADDFVDQIPQQKVAFYDFWEHYKHVKKGKLIDNSVITNFHALEKEAGFDPSWTESFLKSMEMDLHKHSYKNFSELETYVYGSAEVIGLYLSKLMKLPDKAYESAQLLGKSMQYVNFIRDIAEDNALGRMYIPQTELKKHGLANLSQTEAKQKPKQFEAMIMAEIKRYFAWDEQARTGFGHIPKRYLVAIKTAADLYRWSAEQILKNPQVVFDKKVKPIPPFVIWTGLKN